jgi:hypothetical protein
VRQNPNRLIPTATLACRESADPRIRRRCRIRPGRRAAEIFELRNDQCETVQVAFPGNAMRQDDRIRGLIVNQARGRADWPGTGLQAQSHRRPRRREAGERHRCAPSHGRSSERTRSESRSGRRASNFQPVPSVRNKDVRGKVATKHIEIIHL